jgi:hypothetical protein
MAYEEMESEADNWQNLCKTYEKKYSSLSIDMRNLQSEMRMLEQ